MSVKGESISIVLIQAIEGAKPHKALLVLSDRIDQQMGQAVLGGQVFKTQVFLPGLNTGCSKATHQEKSGYEYEFQAIGLCSHFSLSIIRSVQRRHEDHHWLESVDK